jgi:hypothetical protein
MVERQVFGVLLLAAILTAVAVADINARPLHRAFAAVSPNMDVMPQTYDRWNRKSGRWGMQDIVAVILFDKNRSPKP